MQCLSNFRLCCVGFIACWSSRDVGISISLRVLSAKYLKSPISYWYSSVSFAFCFSLSGIGLKLSFYGSVVALGFASVSPIFSSVFPIIAGFEMCIGPFVAVLWSNRDI